MPDVTGQYQMTSRVKYLPRLQLDKRSYFFPITMTSPIAAVTRRFPASAYDSLLDTRGLSCCMKEWVAPGSPKSRSRRNQRADRRLGETSRGCTVPFRDRSTLDLVADQNGIYLLDEKTGQTSTLVEESFHQRARLWAGAEMTQPLHLYVATSKQILIYECAKRCGCRTIPE